MNISSGMRAAEGAIEDVEIKEDGVKLKYRQCRSNRCLWKRYSGSGKRIGKNRTCKKRRRIYQVEESGRDRLSLPND